MTTVKVVVLPAAAVGVAGTGVSVGDTDGGAALCAPGVALGGVDTDGGAAVVATAVGVAVEGAGAAVEQATAASPIVAMSQSLN
jgi:hypothetical protein